MGLVLYALGDVKTRSYTYLPPSIVDVMVDANATFICPLTLLGNDTTKELNFVASGCFFILASPVYPVKFKAVSYTHLTLPTTDAV